MASQCRPLSLTVHLEGAEPGGTSPRVRPQLVRGGPLRLLGQHPPERPPPARAHGLARRAHARLAPVPEGALHDAILARVIADHAQPPARLERRAQRRERQLDLLQLLVHRDAQRLEEAREVGRAGADRKSTRLNSSHGYISYAVFCLKKKNTD